MANAGLFTLKTVAPAAALAERQEKGAAAQPLCGLVLINLSKSNPPDSSDSDCYHFPTSMCLWLYTCLSTRANQLCNSRGIKEGKEEKRGGEKRSG